MCKELVERQTEENFNLHFNDFCNHVANVNRRLILNSEYNFLQLQVFKLTGKFLDDKNCQDIVLNKFQTEKNLGKWDILNRGEERFFS